VRDSPQRHRGHRGLNFFPGRETATTIDRYYYNGSYSKLIKARNYLNFFIELFKKCNGNGTNLRFA